MIIAEVFFECAQDFSGGMTHGYPLLDGAFTGKARLQPLSRRISRELALMQGSAQAPQLGASRQ